MNDQPTPGTDLATVEGHGSALAIDAHASYWNDAQLAVIRQFGNAEQATEADLQVFHHVCARTGLDPFAGQIRLMGRRQKTWDPDTRTEKHEMRFTIQTGIDGYRVLARRAADRAGVTLEYEDTEWADSAGNWVTVWTKATAPAAARVTVLRDGLRFSAVALYAEYVQTKSNGEPNQMWTKMPAGQLAKCAEALALRKAFPQDLSDVYVDEEMGQADNTVTGQVVETQTPRTRPERRRRGGLDSVKRSGPEEAPDDVVEAASKVEHREPSGSESQPLDPDNAEHGELIKRMVTKLDEIGVGPDREGFADHLTRVLGRPITAYTDMTVADVTTVVTDVENKLELNQDPS